MNLAARMAAPRAERHLSCLMRGGCQSDQEEADGRADVVGAGGARQVQAGARGERN